MVLRSPSLLPQVQECHAPAVAYQLFDNDSIGDCTVANLANLLMQQAAARGRSLSFTARQVRDHYFALTGGADTGLCEVDVLADAEENGFLSIGLPLVHAIDPAMPDAHLARLCAFFGGLYVGAMLPASAEAQEAAGKGWDLIDGEDPIVAGHAMLVTDWWPDGSVDFGTYGRKQRATAGWRRAHVDEIYVVADTARLLEPGEAGRLIELLGPAT